ncbi:Hypothetical protein PBC10988_18060 [Planctomycetales bacterium 10988]|nr:Hypothetical protein PBC10988_18060 [Planctomycetales bacterium 10988]
MSFSSFIAFPLAPLRSLAVIVGISALFLSSSLQAQSEQEKEVASEESYSFQVSIQPQETTRVKLMLEVGGKLKLADMKNRSIDPIDMSVVANLNYEEQWQLGDPHQVGGQRTIRYYQDPDATIKVGTGRVIPFLREDRRLIVSDRSVEGKPVLFSPQGPLTRDELDLLEVPCNTMALYTLLPEESQKIGDSWQAPADSWGAVLSLDAVSQSDVKSTLTEVSESEAIVDSQGVIDAAIGGVATEMEIESKCHFDLKSKRIKHFGLVIREKRSIGHVAPGLEVVARLRIALSPIDKSDYLNDKRLEGVQTDPHPAVTMLVYEQPGQYFFFHPRDWYLLENDSQNVVLRLVRRGDLMAQCNIRAAKVGEDAPEPTMKNFQKQVQQVLGDQFEKFIDAGQVPHEVDYNILRLEVAGTASNLPIRWIYYLVNVNERQAVFTFTTEEALVESLKSIDYEIVSSFRYLEAIPDEENAPTPAEAEEDRPESAQKQTDKMSK